MSDYRNRRDALAAGAEPYGVAPKTVITKNRSGLMILPFP
jgi:hypothetical protein